MVTSHDSTANDVDLKLEKKTFKKFFELHSNFKELRMSLKIFLKIFIGSYNISTRWNGKQLHKSINHWKLCILAKLFND